jgi:hypothetical protein
MRQLLLLTGDEMPNIFSRFGLKHERGGGGERERNRDRERDRCVLGCNCDRTFRMLKLTDGFNFALQHQTCERRYLKCINKACDRQNDACVHKAGRKY